MALNLRAQPPVSNAAEGISPGYRGGVRRGSFVLLCVMSLAVLLAFFCAWQSHSFLAQCDRLCSSSAETLWAALVTEFFLSPWLFGSYALALILEHVVPARRHQAEGSFGFAAAFDFLWAVPKLAFLSIVFPLYTALLQYLYDSFLSGLTVHALDGLPWLVRLGLGLMLADFAAWLSHVLRHKFGVFWQFHAIHHSQTRLNFFTEYRSHFIDDLLKLTVEAIPLFMVQQSFVEVLLINRMRYWYTTIYHSNIKSDFGILRYILVTPQSHRIHHSIEPRHRDKNFGLTFSIWDHLFGTQYRRYDEYPETGVADAPFPVESEKEKGWGAIVFLDQLLYPFSFSAVLARLKRIDVPGKAGVDADRCDQTATDACLTRPVGPARWPARPVVAAVSLSFVAFLTLGPSLVPAIMHHYGGAIQRFLPARFYRDLAPFVEDGPPVSGSRDVTFGDAARLNGVYLRWLESGALAVSARWSADRHPEKAKNVGVHLIDATGAIVGQADHPLLPSNAIWLENLEWCDRFVIRPEKIKGATTLGIAVFDDPEKTYPIHGGRCDWGGHRLLLPLPE